MIRAAASVSLLLVLASGAVAQAPTPVLPDPVWDSARVAWDEGNYPLALARLERMLTGPYGESFLERAALLTGELYLSSDVAPDGRQVRWSPGGRYAAIEQGLGNNRRTLILRYDGAFTRVADLPGFGLVFAPGDGFAGFITAEGPRDIALGDGTQRAIPSGGLRIRSLLYGPDGSLFASAASATDTTGNIYALGPETPPALTSGPGGKTLVAAVRGATVYAVNRDRIAIRGETAETWQGPGLAPAVSPDGRTLAFVARSGNESSLMLLPLQGGEPRVVVRRPHQLLAPAWSPDGQRLAYQAMPREDWEIFVIGVDGRGERRLTREIQHDLLPVFVNDTLLLEKIGEARHRRSYLVNLGTGERTRLFHNNLVRTVAPEYAWAPSPDGRSVLIVADRDGNTVSPERGVYLMDLTRRVSVNDLVARVRAAAAAEHELREWGRQMFASIAPRVRIAVADISVPRIDRYAHDFFSLDSKFITQPGNRRAIEYIANQLRSFGYEPVLQEFEPRPGVRSANIVAELRGTVDPDLTYVVSSHFDSVEPSPGADDDASGSSALLETARVLANRPQARSIRFAFFTAEEAGLLGAREFARRYRADSVKVVGALNNDMIGWMNDHRFDNTIRYSNDGLRELQHAAALEFTSLILYDSKYYQGTDASALFEVYGDIIGGIGSYPILGSPHYHQTHDVLETIDMRQVAEVAKTTVASLMLMASSPSRLTGLAASWEQRGVVAQWRAAVESGVRRYRVTYGPPERPSQHTLTTTTPRASLPRAEAGWIVRVKAVATDGLESWDWARATVPSQ